MCCVEYTTSMIEVTVWILCVFSIITNSAKAVHIAPVADAPTYVNGDLITSPTRLHHVSSISQL